MNKVEINLKAFFEALNESYKNYLTHGSRSIKKLRPVHKWIGETYKSLLGDEYKIYYLDGKELIVNGRYYPKQVDIGISKSERTIFVVSFKFITSNYKQNVNNFFENLLGECANIRTQDIGFGHILVLRDKIPYYEEGRDIKKWEEPDDSDLEKYVRLFRDKHRNNFFHSPNYLSIVIVSIKPIIEEIMNKGPGTSGYEEDISSYLKNVNVTDGIDNTKLSQELKETIKEEMNLQQFFNVTVQFIKKKESR